MHAQIDAAEYDSWPGDQSRGIEIVAGMVTVMPGPATRHQRLARLLAQVLEEAAGPDWMADIGPDLRLQDVPLASRAPDVVVYRATALDATPMRPEHVLLVAEVVSPVRRPPTG